MRPSGPADDRATASAAATATTAASESPFRSFRAWPVRVQSPRVRYTDRHVEAQYEYRTARVTPDLQRQVLEAREHTLSYTFRTELRVPRLGLLQVGWGGNNGSTVTAAVVANRERLSWAARGGPQAANYYGSLTQAATVHVGSDAAGRDVYVPLSSLLPMVHPNDLVLGGWDVSSLNLADALERAQVLEPDLRRQLRPLLQDMRPWPGAFDRSFIASNQWPRADNVLAGGKGEQLRALRGHIQQFKREHALERAVVVWTGNSERYSSLPPEAHQRAPALLAAIDADHAEVSPSTLYAVAAVLEHCPFVNGSPQNTLLPSVVELARQHHVPVLGDDFKSGQTRLKSVLVDYLLECGFKVRAMVTYNHLGNNDMYQLTDRVMWQPKSSSKSRVIDDLVASNGLLYGPHEQPDHAVVVQYVPYLGDSKRDVSEYTSEAFMGAHYTSVMHNECLDSMLCAPLIIDTAILCELFTRVSFRRTDAPGDYEPLHPVLSVLGFFMKSPQVPPGEPVVNALRRQRACLENMLRALVGLPPESHLRLESKCRVEAPPSSDGESGAAGAARPVAAE
ncbi:hypothetical protein CDCA_CDCA05G1600 [Cyanidium caldarium]|uniref:inositol-3-phosphate synthase n=1 Tax=Cyanidium caldarium TaxID=2771 RepID=A0AAV9ITY7_CYACA|nr:hypothetical protein CDCA_CDCA05G1600 [Cyanidium caldarium]